MENGKEIVLLGILIAIVVYVVINANGQSYGQSCLNETISKSNETKVLFVGWVKMPKSLEKGRYTLVAIVERDGIFIVYFDNVTTIAYPRIVNGEEVFENGRG